MYILGSRSHPTHSTQIEVQLFLFLIFVFPISRFSSKTICFQTQLFNKETLNSINHKYLTKLKLINN